MSLQVWLPLNGDINNNGLLGNLIATQNSSPAVNNSGKIGKCYSFDGVDDFVNINADKTFFSGKEITFSAWLKCTFATSGSSKSGTVMEISGDLCLTFNCDSTQVRYGFWRAYSNNGTRSGDVQNSGIYLPNNEWHHVAVTFDHAINKIYIDGSLVQTIDSSSKYTTNFVPLLGSAYSGINVGYSKGTASTSHFPGHINDVRVYDHALSIKEVKELAKGLSFHCKLNNLGFGSENMVSGVLDGLPIITSVSKRSDKVWCNRSGGNATVSVVEDNTAYIGQYVYRIAGNTSGNKDVAQYDIDNPFTLSTSKKYTMSAYFRGSGTSLLRIWNDTSGAQLNGQSKAFNTNGKWERISYTFTGPSGADGINNVGFLFGITGAGTTDICGMKVEEGEVATEWAPSIYDTTYLPDIYDCSGYNWPLTHTNIGINLDSPRYSNSLSLNGTDDYISVPYNSICPTNIFTINLWFYKSSLGSKSYETLFGGPSGFEMDTRSGSSSTLSLYMASTRGGNVFSPFEFNKWYMVTMTRDETNELYYVNGELKKTITAKSMPTGNYFIGAWQTNSKQNYKGLLSDFRIYNTVLSASDILELYQNTVSIDRANNLYAREVVEV